jgi:glycyl-tRNA synthetase beta chain
VQGLNVATRKSRNTRSAPRPAAVPSLLIELLTEELPPKSLRRLSESLRDQVYAGLKELGFLSDASAARAFATPRRLAVRVTAVRARQPDRTVERRGPAVGAGLDAQGRPTPALLGFARSCGVDVKELDRQRGDKGEYFVYRALQKGEPLAAHLAALVEAALRRLPVAKLMRWGSGEAEFVRPVHGVMMLHGSRTVPGEVLGLTSRNRTLGHRFLSKGPIAIPGAEAYEARLRKPGLVIADFDERVALIRSGLDAAAAKVAKDASWAGPASEGLLDEVASIVEHPAVYAGSFDPAFLEVPPECLIISMQQHQKYFPLTAGGRLLPSFLFVANIAPKDPRSIIHGNERVLRARLSDARFFFEQDRKTRLEARVAHLAQVVYQSRLGTQLERVERIERLAAGIARLLDADVAAARRAARLAKADLSSEMVGEFPELQGTMGRYYALHDGESAAVAQAIEQHYWPRFAGDALPESDIGAAVALADRLDALAGLFGIGQQPTGDKDPFGLRRAALGVIRIVIEKQLPLALPDLVKPAVAGYAGRIGDCQTEVETFIFDRLQGYLRDQGYSPQEINSVMIGGRRPHLAELPDVLKAVKSFQRLPEAAALAAANKRIVNIIRKAGVEKIDADAELLHEPAERALYEAMLRLKPDIESRTRSRDFHGALQALADLKQPVDAFFDQVMVMAEDARVRDNRLALLGDLKRLMNRVVDIAELAT